MKLLTSQEVTITVDLGTERTSQFRFLLVLKFAVLSPSDVYPFFNYGSLHL
jgi:hypothetical protein